MIITAALFVLAAVNLFNKPAATIGGVGFTVISFVLLSLGERQSRRKGEEGGPQSDRFRLKIIDRLSPETLGVRLHPRLVGVHDPEALAHLGRLLKDSDPLAQDIVVVSVSDDPNPA